MASLDADRSLEPYSAETDSAVLYLPVVMEGEVVGYLWAAESNDAISFLRRLAAPRDTFLAAAAWSDRLDQAEEEGLTPLQALRRWVGEPEDPEAGGIEAGAKEQRVPDLRTLEELANPGLVEPPFDDDEFFPDGTPMNRSKGWGDLSPFTLKLAAYRVQAEGAIRYLPVTRGRELLGYLWASDKENAAFFVKQTAAGIDATYAIGLWLSRLREAKQNGLSPLQALRRWVGEPEDSVGGCIAADAEEGEMSSVDALEELANSDREG